MNRKNKGIIFLVISIVLIVMATFFNIYINNYEKDFTNKIEALDKIFIYQEFSGEIIRELDVLLEINPHSESVDKFKGMYKEKIIIHAYV